MADAHTSPEDGKNFDGVIGKNLSNPIPDWAEHSAERKTVPYTSADPSSRNLHAGVEFLHEFCTGPGR